MSVIAKRKKYYTATGLEV